MCIYFVTVLALAARLQANSSGNHSEPARPQQLLRRWTSTKHTLNITQHFLPKTWKMFLLVSANWRLARWMSDIWEHEGYTNQLVRAYWLHRQPSLNSSKLIFLSLVWPLERLWWLWSLHGFQFDFQLDSKESTSHSPLFASANLQVFASYSRCAHCVRSLRWAKAISAVRLAGRWNDKKNVMSDQMFIFIIFFISPPPVLLPLKWGIRCYAWDLLLWIIMTVTIPWQCLKTGRNNRGVAKKTPTTSVSLLENARRCSNSQSEALLTSRAVCLSLRCHIEIPHFHRKKRQILMANILKYFLSYK